MATELGLSSKSVIVSICVFLGIEIHKIPRNCLRYTYTISKADSNKTCDFIKLHPDKKERANFLRNMASLIIVKQKNFKVKDTNTFVMMEYPLILRGNWQYGFIVKTTA